jgi:hypothetical protein
MLGLLVAAMTLVWIWVPEFTLWYVRPANPSAEIIARSRSAPQEDVLSELGRMEFKPPLSPLGYDETVRRAEAVARGVLILSGFPDIPISPVFSPVDLQKGPLLLMASLPGVEQLLDAYRITGREDFFQLAKENILAFARFESARLLDLGLLWNDHAIGARIPVLIKFWEQYRQREDFDPQVAREVLSLVARSGLLLAKPEHYAWRTGHGIISNLALLQISIAFPFLQESGQFRDVAKSRLSMHFPYYVNREGATLLHSAGYNNGGVFFLAMAMRLYTLGNQPFPEEWWRRYQKVEDFYAQLRRPDGTLPMFGDTGSAAEPFGPPRTRRLEGGGVASLERTTDWPQQGGVAFYPEAGHAILWYPPDADKLNALSQTVATWSYYPGLGHKIADELSVLLWAGGRTWITNAGYWPYGHKYRKLAESWGGSNAPHLSDEAASSERSSKLLKTGTDDKTFFLEMERRGPDGFMVRREVLQVGGTWIVLDHQRDRIQRETATHWTFYPDLVVGPGQASGSFTVSAPYSRQAMLCTFQTSKDGQIERVSGSLSPLTGWVVMGREPVAADTIAVHGDSRQGWELAVFSLYDRNQQAHQEDLVATVSGAENLDRWTITINGVAGNPGMSVVRDQDRITIHRHGVTSDKTTLNLTDVPDPQPAIAPVLAAFEAATERSVRRVPLISYRLKVTYFLLGLLVIQELLFALVHRRLPGLNVGLRTMSIIAWAGAGFWLTNFYLVAG